jgi:probable rRNA maturation factor
LQKVFFHYADRRLTIKAKTKIKEVVHSIFKKEKLTLQRIDYIFCSDEYLLEINRQFLNHDYYTDIITFNLSESKEITGEVYISLDRVKENAGLLNVAFLDELVRVVFHGALHLCGYKDKKKSDIELMRSNENYYIKLLQKR